MKSGYDLIPSAERSIVSLGGQGVTATAIVDVGRPVERDLRYYVRTGGHDIHLEDWKHYIAFADDQLRGRKYVKDNVKFP
jgi:hypothetical protein